MKLLTDHFCERKSHIVSSCIKITTFNIQMCLVICICLTKAANKDKSLSLHILRELDMSLAVIIRPRQASGDLRQKIRRPLIRTHVFRLSSLSGSHKYCQSPLRSRKSEKTKECPWQKFLFLSRFKRFVRFSDFFSEFQTLMGIY